jgi:hypothetical protein
VLKKFLEYGYYNKSSALIALFLGTLGEKINSYLIKGKYNETTSKGSLSITYSLPEFNGDNEVVNKISNYLNTTNHKAIVATIIHGSISDNTTNSFSDFDGVLIFDNDQLINTSSIYSLRKIVKDTQKMMMNFDALQHHGWMILEKKELLNYNNTIFPSVIFEDACIIYPSSYNSISLHINEQDNPKIPFLNLSKSIENKLILKSNLKYFYFYKNLVSEILLLPATYYQAINGNPINKKDSFIESKNIFNNAKWEVIENFENLRKSWDQSNLDKSKELKALKYKIIKKYSLSLRSRTPQYYLDIFNEDLILKVRELINEMKNRI